MEICQPGNNLAIAGNCDLKSAIDDVNGNHSKVVAPQNSSGNCKTDKESEKKYELKVGYIFSKKLDQEINKNEKIENRSLMLNSLLYHSGVLKKMKLYNLTPVDSLDDLRVFHSEEYLQFLANPDPDLEEDFGCVYDCPVMDEMDDFVKTVASASITAANLLIRQKVDVAINWSGGWHHARRDSAAGFCYVNDIVLSIHKLQSKFKRILYIDLDVHHGDAVEDAFSSTSRVVTLSLHKQEPGFFPGTGFINDVGFGKGKYYSVNVPLKSGINDESYCRIFDSVFHMVHQKINPDVIVLQCGVDGLAGDPHGGFNLTPQGLSHCVHTVVQSRQPVLLLGGGGYNIPNSVRCWTRITADLLDIVLPEEIPDSDPYFLEYGPDFTFNISPTNVKNSNTDQEVEQILNDIKINMKNIPIVSDQV